MTTIVKMRGGTTMEHQNFTGALREITVDTNKNTIVVHDGETPGGFPLAREDLSNVERKNNFYGLFEENGYLKAHYSTDKAEENNFKADDYLAWFFAYSNVEFSIDENSHLILKI